MEDDDKPFACSFDGCKMRFTNEDHLTVHKKKHDMVLNFDSDQKPNAFVADQTPTPTRFIRNCEEVGLFQDLQNVNPFEETFRKAVELAKTGGGPLHEVDPLGVHTGGDDTLHTPHVFPHIIEDSTSNSSSSYKISGTPVSSSTSVIIGNTGKKLSTSASERQELDQLLRPTSTTDDENCSSEVITTNILEERRVISHNGMVVGIGNTRVVRQEADTSQQKVVVTHETSKQIVAANSGDKTVNKESTGAVSPGGSTVQLLLRLPNGKLLQLSALPVEQGGTSGNEIIVQPPSVCLENQQIESTPTRTVGAVLTTQPASVSTAVHKKNKNVTVTPKSSAVPEKQQTSLSLAKLKLKQTLTKNNRSATTSSKETTPPKKPIPKNPHLGCESVAGLRTDLAPSSANSIPSRRSSSSSNAEDSADKRQIFLARNRAAAMRCREKRKSWIVELERRAEDMQSTNQQLQGEVAALRAEVASLKTLLLAHKDCPVTQAMAQGSGVPLQTGQGPTTQFITLPITVNSQPAATQPATTPQNLVLVNGSASKKRSASEPLQSPVKKVMSVNTGLPIIRQALLIPTTQPGSIQVINSSRLRSVPTSTKSSSSSAPMTMAPIPSGQTGVLVTSPIMTIPVTVPPNSLALSAVIQNSTFPQTIAPVVTSVEHQSLVTSDVQRKEGGVEISSNVIKVNPNAMRKSVEDTRDPLSLSDDDSDDIRIISEVKKS